jgi:hypothetical protein
MKPLNAMKIPVKCFADNSRLTWEALDGVVHGVDDGAQRMPRQLRAQQDVVDDVEQHLSHRRACTLAAAEDWSSMDMHAVARSACH